MELSHLVKKRNACVLIPQDKLLVKVKIM